MTRTVRLKWRTHEAESTQAKSQPIGKRQVWEAWKHVRTGGKATGVDGLSIEEIDSDLAGYLYPLWNRLSSGSYMPPPVREKSISKGDGKERKLGIPTVLDRAAHARYLLWRIRERLGNSRWN